MMKKNHKLIDGKHHIEFDISDELYVLKNKNIEKIDNKITLDELENYLFSAEVK